jgi:hypothetical protein
MGALSLSENLPPRLSAPFLAHAHTISILPILLIVSNLLCLIARAQAAHNTFEDVR